MSNVTVQEAFRTWYKSKYYKYDIYPKYHQFRVEVEDAFIQGYKDALSEIEKCEPVGELILDPAFLPALKAPLVNWKINLVDLEVGTKLYTSPQPRDWVGLNYPEILDCLPEGAKRVPEGWQEFYEAIEAKLKQLNTKG